MDKINGKFVSPSPQIKDRKMARFGFCAASSLSGGGGGGGGGVWGLLFHSILSKIVVSFAAARARVTQCSPSRDSGPSGCEGS